MSAFCVLFLPDYTVHRSDLGASDRDYKQRHQNHKQMTTTTTLRLTHSKFLIIVPLLLTLLSSLFPVTAEAATTAPVDSVWHYKFGVNGTLVETGSMSNSSSPYFWLNSGGALTLKDGQGHTVQGRLKLGSYWQKLYGTNNPLDTDGGYLPQNLFRLVTRNTWTDVSEEVRFKINKVNLTDTPNRDGYSGILLMSRYRDGNNLYYAGIRQDGTAIIKKKSGGKYTTLGSARVWSGTYNKTTNPNLIPEDTWMRLKSETDTLTDGSTKVTLYLDEQDSGSWKKLLEVTDKSGDADGAPVAGPAHTGIRTDYMDVSFDDYIHRKI